ncbi:MAG: hypothetical protein J6T42_04380, partial [Clostridia bacterium]|nr:hypothetical protein [Clostridia bacterium]
MKAKKKKFIAFIEEFETDEFGKPVSSLVEETATEAVTEEVAAAEAVAEDFAVEKKAKYVNKSFAQKMMLADEVIKDRYDELKNYALRFKRLKARISKKFDSIN